jgi:hypothetical protein
MVKRQCRFPVNIPAFKRQWPEVHFTLHDLKITQQLEGLRRCELDVFLWLPIPTEGLDVQELLDEPLVAVVPRPLPPGRRQNDFYQRSRQRTPGAHLPRARSRNL